MNKYPVLILSLDYQPFDIWSWKKTMRKLLGSHSILPIYNSDGNIIKHDKVIKDGKGNEYELPAVAILKKYIKTQHDYASYSRINIYARDSYKCQYCGKEVLTGNRSIDHVLPKSQFNSRKHKFKLHSFENVVTCCTTCNLRKANRTPEQAGMKLIHKPIKPLRIQVYRNKLSLIHNPPRQWRQFLLYESKKTTNKV